MPDIMCRDMLAHVALKRRRAHPRASCGTHAFGMTLAPLGAAAIRPLGRLQRPPVGT
jgi:hypothetical protein